MSSMPQPGPAGQPDVGDIVIGVDTHKDVHVVVALTITGVLLGSKSFPTTAAGYGFGCRTYLPLSGQPIMGWGRHVQRIAQLPELPR